LEKTLTSRRATAARYGFTLIELLVVIVILAILAAVVIPKVVGRTDDAKMSAATTDVSTFDNLMDHYKLDTGHYPSQDAGLQALVTNVENDPKWGGAYIKGALHNDPWGHPYMYAIPSQHGMDYDIWSAGPDGQAANQIGNWNLQH